MKLNPKGLTTMTHSTANHSTITNQLEATKVSSLASKDSNKNEIISHFKAAKHAKQKIEGVIIS
jgi:hypothetical protein